MNSKHPYELSTKKIDWNNAMASRIAAGLTRRNVLCRLGYFAATILGAEFLIANVPRARGTVIANPPCQLELNYNCTPTSINCGMQPPAVDCGGAVPSNPNCMQANGCPAGTAPGENWRACCTCPENSSVGVSVLYTDCCGSVDKTKCSKWSGLGHSCTNKLCGASQSWCQTSGSNNYVCTKIVAAGKCTPGA